MSIKDGGPFHPVTINKKAEGGVVVEYDVYMGASIRDEIAIRMLPVIYHEYHAAIARGEFSRAPEWRIRLSLDAYAMADAMLLAREASQ